jgi:hypothetical protein
MDSRFPLVAGAQSTHIRISPKDKPLNLKSLATKASALGVLGVLGVSQSEPNTMK